MMNVNSMKLLTVALACWAGVLAACSDNRSGISPGPGNPGDGSASDTSPGAGGSGITLGSGGAGGTAGGVDGGPAGSDAGGATDATVPVPVPVTCEVPNPQCNDGMDNDGDNKFDSLDPECVGPCDNDEGSFATGIAGDNIDACKQDCFFDGNSGMGDDGCDWNLKCDSANPGGTSCPYDATYKNCSPMQSQKCIRNCQKLTPNGCDCFGCCAVTAGGQPVNVMLVATCTAAKFGDPVACPRCTQNQACVNSCDKCEVCIGRAAPDPSCTTSGGTGGSGGSSDAGTGTTQCPTGVTSCGPGGQVEATACGAGFYCQTGCCIRYTIE
jgi:hypothetical protein